MNQNEPAWSSYRDVVTTAVVPRFRVVTVFGAFLFMIFSPLLDLPVYPDRFDLLLRIRIAAAGALVVGFALSYLEWVRARLIWLADTLMVTSGLAIILMIYVTEGAASGYFQGLNLVFMAMLTINTFHFAHNLVSGSLILAGYLVAVFARGGATPALLAEPVCFLGGTLGFVVILTRLYARQHRSEYRKSRELAASAASLEDALRKLRATEKLKDSFVANVSHELRTPLCLILEPVRKLLRDPRLPEPERVRDLQIVERNAALLLRHVNDLLEVSRLDSGNTALSYEKCRMDRIVRLTASHFEVMAAEHSIELTIEAPESIQAEVDPEKIQRVLLNLLSNAFKFTPDGGKIICRLRQAADRAEISVSDTGPGVPVELREVIFDRFRQGELGDTRRHGGTGLGLAIARELVRLHRGDINVVSSVSGGACFRVAVPLRTPVGTIVGEERKDLSTERMTLCRSDIGAWVGERPSECGSGLEATTMPPEDGPSDRGRILVVEDNTEMNRFLAGSLRTLGSVASARNGIEALALARRERPDLIVTDIMMPGMSGEQLVRALRSDAGLSDVPVLVLTAKADDELRERLLAEGAHDYLYKPFTTAELVARANNLLSMKRVRDLLARELETKTDDLFGMASALAASRREAAAALRRAQSAARAKDEFLMNLSHELRTPLTAILGWAELLQADPADEKELRDGMDAIVRNARAQLHLVEDLMDTSRIVRGKLALRLERRDLREVVSMAVRAVGPSAANKGISLSAETGDVACEARVDFERMQQVIWNLLTNAVKFTSAGGRVTVTVESSDGEIIIRVSDTGEGIEPEFLTRVFERMEQADTAMGRRHGGLGLGLAISRHLVEMHGGRIAAESGGRGKGATFTVWLPRPEPERPGRVTSERSFVSRLSARP